MRFRAHSPGAVGAIKIDWLAPVELDDSVRVAMAPHDLTAMRAGVLMRGFVVGSVTYPRGTLAFRVAEGHELFLQLPVEAEPVAAVVVPSIAALWTVDRAGQVDRHRGVVGTDDDGERLDVIIATHVPSISRAKVQQLIELGRVVVAGQPSVKSNRRMRAGDRIELEIELPPAT